MRTPSTTLICILALAPCVTTTAGARGQYTFFSDTEYRGASGDLTYGLATAVVVCEQRTLKPIACFGAAKPTNGQAHFLYLLIFKTKSDARVFGLSADSHGSSDAGAAGKVVVRLGKKQVEIAYDLTTDPKTHAVGKQSLALAGREVREGGPRVFVVDLTGEAVRCTPVKVELPKGVPDVSQGKGQAWGAVIEKAIEQLKKDSPELAKLLAATPRGRPPEDLTPDAPPREQEAKVAERERLGRALRAGK
jgi:hypothetical protein